MSRKLAVIAIGGNSLIKHRDKQSVEDQYLALCETMEHIADVIARKVNDPAGEKLAR